MSRSQPGGYDNDSAYNGNVTVTPADGAPAREYRNQGTGLSSAVADKQTSPGMPGAPDDSLRAKKAVKSNAKATGKKGSSDVKQRAGSSIPSAGIPNAYLRSENRK